VCEGLAKCISIQGWALEGCACVPHEGTSAAAAAAAAVAAAHAGVECASPCLEVNVRETNEAMCAQFLSLPLIKPTCHGIPAVVPRVYHAMAAGDEPPLSVRTNLVMSPGYRLNYHNDVSGLAYIMEKCGRDAAEAFRCFVAPAYRADLFRFCALHADGGVYLDADLHLMVPIDEVYSPCCHATVGEK
jgi:hypothetical protein